MAYDKVVDSAALEAGLTQIADAIREKGGTSGSLSFPEAMAAAIAAIEAGGSGGEYDFSGLNNPITHALSGTITVASDIRALTIRIDDSLYLPRIVVCYAETAVSGASYVNKMLVLGMADDPETEYETGPVGGTCYYGTGTSAYSNFNSANSLYNNSSVYRMMSTDATGWKLYAPQTSSTSSSAKKFEAGITYRWMALCEGVAQ